MKLERWENNYDYFEKGMKRLILSEEDTIFYVYADDIEKPYVIVGRDEINEQYCVDNSLPIVRGFHTGGTFITFKGDFIVNEISNNKRSIFASQLFAEMEKWLVSKGYNATRDKNDLLVDGFKVAGNSKSYIADKAYSVVTISIYADNEVIKNIVKREQVKIPKGLINFGIGESDVMEFLRWFFDFWAIHNGQTLIELKEDAEQ